MIPALRRAFNEHWTEARYRAHLDALTNRAGEPLGFPVSETPCFFPAGLMAELGDVGAELVRQSLAGDAARAGEAAVPARYRGPGAGPHPAFLQVDFGFVRAAGGRLEPRLVELQAFPSLYGFQLAMAESYLRAFELDATLDPFLGGLDRAAYVRLVGEAIVGPHDPDTVVLLEIDPARQKTRPDFAVTEELWGVRAVDVRSVRPRGTRLVYDRDGREVPIARVYNRVIPDELERRGIETPFGWDADLDVEWVGHPEWYFRVSKLSIPYLRHPSVPRTWFLDDVDGLPAPREDLLLKPLFSFAGGGIVFGPSDEEIAGIPAARRHDYILQERLAFAPIIETPDGATQAEVRVMYVWTDRLRPVLPLIRMGRGRMMGVDHNKGLRWVGASAGLMAGT
ncbi:MAG: hypothetical protein AB1635_16775 [Acidobacteriota bacterium]